MKKYNFEMQTFSGKTEKKLKRKLYIMSLKNSFTNFFSTSNLKIILPAFSLAIFVFGFFNYTNFTQKQNLENKTEIAKTISSKDYKSIAKNRVLKAKMDYYKKYSTIRKARSLAVR